MDTFPPPDEIRERRDALHQRLEDLPDEVVELQWRLVWIFTTKQRGPDA